MDCPGCGKSFKVPDEYIGKRVQCNKCGEKFVVPPPESAVAPEPKPDPQPKPQTVTSAFEDIDDPNLFAEDNSNLDELLEKLQDGDKKERREAARQIREVADPESVDVLMDCMGDDDVEVRRCIAETFGEIGGKIALAGLIGMAYDDDLVVRVHAYEGMVHMPEAADLELSAYFDLAEMIRWQFGEMREACVLIGKGKLKETPYLARRMFWRCDSMYRNPYFEDVLDFEYKMEVKKYRSHFAALCDEFGIEVAFD